MGHTACQALSAIAHLGEDAPTPALAAPDSRGAPTHRATAKLAAFGTGFGGIDRQDSYRYVCLCRVTRANEFRCAVISPGLSTARRAICFCAIDWRDLQEAHRCPT